MLENFGKKLSDIGSQVFKGTQNFGSTVQLSAKIEGCKRDMAQIYQQIGQQYYRDHAEDASGSYRPMIDRIEELKNTIESYQSEIQRLKGVRPCPKCGAAVPNEAAFCSACGYNIGPLQVEAEEEAAGGFCAACGAPLGAGDEFCTSCGAKRGETAPSDLKDIPDPVQNVQEPGGEAVSHDGASPAD